MQTLMPDGALHTRYDDLRGDATTPLTLAQTLNVNRGTFRLAALADVVVTIGEVRGRRRLHLRPGCAEAARQDHTHAETLAQLREHPPAPSAPAAGCGCTRDVERWLGPDLTVTVRRFVETNRLISPWATARAEAKAKGRELVPEDNTALVTGLLDDQATLIRDSAAALAGSPLAVELTDLAEHLEVVTADWWDLLARTEEIAAADPHHRVRAWAHEQGLPDLSGTPKQVRWAERLRFNLWHNLPTLGDLGLGEDYFTRTTAARDWIGAYRDSREDADVTEAFTRRPDEDLHIRQWPQFPGVHLPERNR